MVIELRDFNKKMMTKKKNMGKMFKKWDLATIDSYLVASIHFSFQTGYKRRMHLNVKYEQLFLMDAWTIAISIATIYTCIAHCVIQLNVGGYTCSGQTLAFSPGNLLFTQS